MKRLLAVGALLFAFGLAHEAAAQTGTARGKVVDDKGQPVPEAVVSIEFQGGVTRKFETRTNKKGDYTQVGLAPGVYRFTASKDGLQPVYAEIRINLGDPTYVPELKLVPRPTGSTTAGEANVLQADFKKAADLMAAGKGAEAEAAFKALAEKNPTVPEIHYNLGLLAAQRKDWAGAEAAYKKALEIKPDYSVAYTALSNVYLASNQPDKAAEIASKAMGAAGTDAKALFQVGYVAFNSGKYAEAAEAFKKAEAADPNNAETQFFLGSIALSSNNLDECITRLEKYTTTAAPTSPNVATAQALLQACKQSKGVK
jgi:tetratricopeptide (TPR) repeat protein